MNIPFAQLRQIGIATAAVVAGATSAYAAPTGGTVSFSDSAAPQVPNWSDTLTVSQFNASLGHLDSVTISFTGSNSGVLAAENLASAGLLTLEGNATYSLNSAVWNTSGTATATRTINASAYDNVFDYGGTSGATFTGAAGTFTTSTTLTSNLDAFIGSGLMSFAVGVVGGSAYTGTGAAVVTFNQSADAYLSITYTYSNVVPSAVPEPQTYMLFAAGLFTLGAVARRRRIRD